MALLPLFILLLPYQLSRSILWYSGFGKPALLEESLACGLSDLTNVVHHCDIRVLVRVASAIVASATYGQYVFCSNT